MDRRHARPIAARPGTRAGDLAAAFDRELAPFKLDVRKLKNLGLTISLLIGYRLSPHGIAYLRREGWIRQPTPTDALIDGRHSSPRCGHRAFSDVVRAVCDAELVVMLATAEVDKREPTRRGFRHEVEQENEPGRIAAVGRVVHGEPPDQSVVAEQAEVHGNEMVTRA